MLDVDFFLKVRFKWSRSIRSIVEVPIETSVFSRSWSWSSAKVASGCASTNCRRTSNCLGLSLMGICSVRILGPKTPDRRCLSSNLLTKLSATPKFSRASVVRYHLYHKRLQFSGVSPMSKAALLVSKLNLESLLTSYLTRPVMVIVLQCGAIQCRPLQ